MANRLAKEWANVKLLQFPTCWPIKGLFVHWSRGWGVLSFSERLVLHRGKAGRLLTHRGWVTHICISKLTIIASDNGFSLGWCQGIIWTNAEILFIGPLGTNFNYFFLSKLIHIIPNSIWKNVILKMAAVLSRPQCVNYMPHFYYSHDSVPFPQIYNLTLMFLQAFDIE